MLVAFLIVAGVVLLGVALFAAMRSREADDAVSTLSRETRQRDRASAVLGDEDALTGKQVEKAQVLERKAASRRSSCGPDRPPRPRPTCRRTPRSSVSAVGSSSTAPSS